MNKVKLIVAAIATIFSGNVMAQKLTAADVNIEQGKTADLVLSFDAPEIAAAAQFNLTLPEGITIALDKNDSPDFTKGALLTRDNTVSITPQDGNVYQVLIYNTNAKAAVRTFTDKSGVLLTIPLEAAENATIGEEKGTLTGAKFANFDAQSVGVVPDAEFKINITAVATGINSIQADELAKAGKVYNLQGQRVSNTKQGGLYIVNGKKVIVK